MKVLDSLKFACGLALCILVRLFTIAPNVEPIMGFTMPFAKKYGKYAGLVFALLALVAIDFFTGRIGLWTLYTGMAYAAIGFAAGWFFTERKASRKNFLLFSIAGTLLFDITTALLFGWQFKQSLAVTLMGEVPFTVSHLLGNAAFALLASPALLWALEKTEVKQPAFHSAPN